MAYTKNTWVTGDVVTADKLNHMETGIDTNDSALGTKAEVDGYYEEMTVGDAEQLVATQYVEDAEPYLFRTSGGTADIGNREYDSIVGGTIAWNQIMLDITSADNWNANNGTLSYSDGKITCTASSGNTNKNFGQNTSVSATAVSGHKYLYSINVNKSNSDNYLVIAPRIGQTITITNLDANTDTLITGVMSPSGSSALRFFVYPWGTSTYDADGTETCTIWNPMIIDLTQMFGSTIADYIYTLEQGTSGAGVSYFRKLFPESYYAYNAGELKHVSGLTSHDTVGFNQWDEEWEWGGIVNANGNTFDATDRFRSKNFCACMPSTTYYGKAPSAFLIIYYYDSSYNYIGYEGASNTTITTPSNASYFKIVLANSPTTYNNDICINLSWSGYRNGEYEPYAKHSYPLDSDLILRGVPKLDASNNLYYDGDIYASDGTVTRKYGIVDLGTLWWVYSSSDMFFYAPVSGMYIGNSYGVSDAPYTIVARPNMVDKTMCVNSSYIGGTGAVLIKDSDYTDAATFKAAMSGYLVYELATPTTETADPFQSPQIVDDFGTEEYVLSADAFPVPVGHDTKYPPNLRDKLQHLPSLADDDGYYMINQTDKQMTLERFRIPKAPTSPDGTYVLKAVVSGGTPTYTWEVES